MKTIEGTYTALITPFSADGTEIDYRSLANLIEFQLQAQVDGFVFCGSTAEAQCMSESEYQEVVKRGLEIVKNRRPCLVGISTSNTSKARDMAALIERCGADGILMTAPPYNKPPQDGILAHFRQVKSNTRLPIVAYNIPGRTSVSIHPQTLITLAKEKCIVGVKEASASLDQIMDIVCELGQDFACLSGEDSLVHAIVACGGKGVISASANIAPSQFVRITQAALRGDFVGSLQAQKQVLALVRTLFSETNPIPLKSALYLKGIISHPTLRLPLIPAKPETIEKLKHLLEL